MKKTILILTLTLSTIFTNAQFFTNLGIEYSKVAPAIEWNAGYDFKMASLKAGFVNYLSTGTSGGAIFHIQIGHTITIWKTEIEPSIGYSSTTRSADNKSLNTSGVIKSLFVSRRVSPSCMFFGGINYVNNIV